MVGFLGSVGMHGGGCFVLCGFLLCIDFVGFLCYRSSHFMCGEMEMGRGLIELCGEFGGGERRMRGGAFG